MNIIRLASWSLVASLTFAACGKKEPTPAPAEPAKTEPTKAEPTAEATKAPEPTTTEPTKAPEPTTAEPTKAPEPTADPAVKGRAAPDNDKAILEKLAPIEKCDLTGRYPENDCREALDPFIEASKAPEALPTLLNLSEDPAPWVRWAAAVSLSRSPQFSRVGTEAARDRYYGIVKAETDPVVAKLSAKVLMGGRNEETDPAFEAKLYELATSHPLEDARAAMFAESFRGEAGVKFLLGRWDAETSVPVKRAMVGGLYVIGEQHSAALCPWYAKLLASDDEEVQQSAAYHMVWSSTNCSPQYDVLLDDLDARVKAKKLTFMYTLQITYFVEPKTPSSEAQRKRFIEIMKAAVAEKGNDAMARSKALEVIGKHDPDAKKFAADYLKDESSFVADAAKTITTGK